MVLKNKQTAPGADLVRSTRFREEIRKNSGRNYIRSAGRNEKKAKHMSLKNTQKQLFEEWLTAFDHLPDSDKYEAAAAAGDAAAAAAAACGSMEAPPPASSHRRASAQSASSAHSEFYCRFRVEPTERKNSLTNIKNQTQAMPRSLTTRHCQVWPTCAPPPPTCLLLQLRRQHPTVICQAERYCVNFVEFLEENAYILVFQAWKKARTSAAALRAGEVRPSSKRILPTKVLEQPDECSLRRQLPPTPIKRPTGAGQKSSRSKETATSQQSSSKKAGAERDGLPEAVFNPRELPSGASFPTGVYLTAKSLSRKSTVRLTICATHNWKWKSKPPYSDESLLGLYCVRDPVITPLHDPPDAGRCTFSKLITK